MDNPLVNIDGESIERNVNEMYKIINKCVRVFVDIPAVQGVALDIKKQIEDFKPLVPLMQALRSPGIRDRHWERFREQTGKNIVCFTSTDISDQHGISFFFIYLTLNK